MALLLSASPPLSSSAIIPYAVANAPSCAVAAAPRSFPRPSWRRHTAVLSAGFVALPLPAATRVVRVSASDEDAAALDLPSEAEAVPSVMELPLESKLQQMAEQKLRMKLAKKIRLRRKRLVQKRHLRKKGRWPPSKMRKNKNV